MTRDELINKIEECIGCEVCSECKYVSSCDGSYELLSDILEYLVIERDAEVEEKGGGKGHDRNHLRTEGAGGCQHQPVAGEPEAAQCAE